MKIYYAICYLFLVILFMSHSVQAQSSIQVLGGSSFTKNGVNKKPEVTMSPALDLIFQQKIIHKAYLEIGLSYLESDRYSNSYYTPNWLGVSGLIGIMYKIDIGSNLDVNFFCDGGYGYFVYYFRPYGKYPNKYTAYNLFTGLGLAYQLNDRFSIESRTNIIIHYTTFGYPESGYLSPPSDKNEKLIRSTLGLAYYFKRSYM